MTNYNVIIWRLQNFNG